MIREELRVKHDSRDVDTERVDKEEYIKRRHTNGESCFVGT